MPYMYCDKRGYYRHQTSIYSPNMKIKNSRIQQLTYEAGKDRELINGDVKDSWKCQTVVHDCVQSLQVEVVDGKIVVDCVVDNVIWVLAQDAHGPILLGILCHCFVTLIQAGVHRAPKDVLKDNDIYCELSDPDQLSILPYCIWQSCHPTNHIMTKLQYAYLILFSF